MLKINDNYATITPEGILPLLKKDEFFKSKRANVIENVLVFCTVLYLHYYYFKEKNGENKNDKMNPFQRIGIDLVIKILARDYYKEILQRLVEIGIIEINNSYLAGKFTKSYRINDRFVIQKPKVRKIKSKAVIAKFENLNQYFLSRYDNYYDYLKPQAENMKLIQIDLDSAIDWIEANKTKIDENKEPLIKDVQHYYRQIYKISSGFNRKLSVSPTNNRVHSSFTSFPKKLRQFLNVVEKETGMILFKKCIIDGRNSQPYFICMKMKQEGIEPDKDFLEFTLNGTLYDMIAAELGESRKWVKEFILRAILFTPSNSKKAQILRNPRGANISKQKIALYFKKRFPQVYNWLLGKKTMLNNSNIETKNPNNRGGSLLAIEIQKMESEIWIHRLLKEIPSDYIYVTIHDSLMLFNPSIEQVNYIEEKVKEISCELYNIELPLSREWYY